VRRALGIERWNVYGESYGTTVAMTLAALHPEPVRSVVLDSVYPPDPMPPHSAIAADALAAFFASCARDQACSTAFPDLAGTYRETLARLDQAPLLVALPPQMHWADDHGLLRASSFEAIVNNLVYYPSAYPNLPRLIESVHEGDTRGIAAVLPSLLAAAATSNRATRAAVECRDRPRYRDVLPATASLLDRMQPHDICDGWSELGAPPLVPVDTKVPTLVLAGQFDPVSGPNFSHHVANQISANAQWIEFPLVGHNVRAFSSCGAKIAADFIEQPTQALDTTCVDRRPPIRFLAK